MHSKPSLDELAFNFFREFSRCEYCLKIVGLRDPNHRDPTADWGAFSAQVQHVLENPASEKLMAAVQYYVANPPKKQVVKNGLLDWAESPPDHKSKTELILRLVCRVRNNLFHGGKFNGHWFAPQRSEELIEHALVILDSCISNHTKVKEAYSQQSTV